MTDMIFRSKSRILKSKMMSWKNPKDLLECYDEWKKMRTKMIVNLSARFIYINYRI